MQNSLLFTFSLYATPDDAYASPLFSLTKSPDSTPLAFQTRTGRAALHKIQSTSAHDLLEANAHRRISAGKFQHLRLPDCAAHNTPRNRWSARRRSHRYTAAFQR